MKGEVMTEFPEAEKKGARLLNRAMDLLQAGEDTMGLCTACEEEAYGVEPDARKYKCESCGKSRVYGCEEIIIMFA